MRSCACRAIFSHMHCMQDDQQEYSYMVAPASCWIGETFLEIKAILQKCKIVWFLTNELKRSSKHQVHCVNKKYSSKCIGKFTTYVAGCSISSSTPRWKKTTKSFCKEWASKLAESDAGSYYNQEKWLKDDKASEKPIETTRNWLLSFFALKKTNQRLLLRLPRHRLKKCGKG